MQLDGEGNRRASVGRPGAGPALAVCFATLQVVFLCCDCQDTVLGEEVPKDIKTLLFLHSCLVAAALFLQLQTCTPTCNPVLPHGSQGHLRIWAGTQQICLSHLRYISVTFTNTYAVSQDVSLVPPFSATIYLPRSWIQMLPFCCSSSF